jgi:hypothetical protein
MDGFYFDALLLGSPGLGFLIPRVRVHRYGDWDTLFYRTDRWTLVKSSFGCLVPSRSVHMLHKCCTKCCTSVAQVLHKCCTSVAQVLHKCCTRVAPLGRLPFLAVVCHLTAGMVVAFVATRPPTRRTMSTFLPWSLCPACPRLFYAPLAFTRVWVGATRSLCPTRDLRCQPGVLTDPTLV